MNTDRKDQTNKPASAWHFIEAIQQQLLLLLICQSQTSWDWPYESSISNPLYFEAIQQQQVLLLICQFQTSWDGHTNPLYLFRSILSLFYNFIAALAKQITDSANQPQALIKLK